MDFLDSLVLPQSAEHMVLLKYLLMLTYLIFIPYLSALIGATAYGLYFDKMGQKEKNPFYFKLAKDLIDFVTFNKSISFGLGVIPLLSAIFCYAQLLHGSQVSLTGYLILSLILLLFGIVFIYTYKYSFHLKDILQDIKEDSPEKKDAEKYHGMASNLYTRTGGYAFGFFFAASYIFVGSLQLAADTARWESVETILGVIFSWATFSYFLHFICAAFAVTSALILYLYFRPNSDFRDVPAEYQAYIKKFALSTGLIFTIAQPFFVAVNLLSTPKIALSSVVFGATVVILFLLLILANYFYAMIRDSNTKYTTSILFLFILVFAFVIIKNQVSFDTASKEQFHMLAADYEEYEKELLAEVGRGGEEISGEEIYKAKCVACHQWDQKLVGPPHNEVLPKYEDNMEGLVDFILNPVKVNPEYPPMPAQGLKPAEAQAVADYLMTTYQSK